MPANASPFYWSNATTGKTSAMLISAFPSTDGATGLTAADKKIEIEVYAKPFASLNSFNAPSQPGAITPTYKENTAAYMQAGVMASAAIIASLI